MTMNKVLDPLIFPLYGTRLIEASAGTGKTYTIAALYLRLVLGHGNENGFSRPLVPPEILVVTFTTAATQELRERIRTRLTEACDFFRGKGDGDDFLRKLKEDFEISELPAKANLLEQAALWMDEAAIQTIHAWCQRMLFQHAFDSLSLFDLTLEPIDQDLLDEAAQEFWRKNFYPRAALILQDFMGITGISTPGELLKEVRPLMNEIGKGVLQFDGSPSDLLGHTPADPFEMLSQRRSAIEAARGEWQEDFNGAVQLVEMAREDKTLNNNSYRKNSLEGWIDQLDAWVNQQGHLPDLVVLEKFSTAGLDKGKSKKGTPPTHPAFDAFDRLIDCLASLDIKQAFLIRAAHDIHCHVIAAKDRLSRMGFDDLLTRLAHALARKGSRLAEVIRSQFPIAMIDEFQDTDPVQYELFSTIYLHQKESGLMMIGDPKQAIYAFRGADIYTYLKARKEAVNNLYTLEKNYRSTHGMVEAVNQIFSQASRFPDGPFLFKDMIPFEPVLSKGRSEEFFVEGQEVESMTLWQMDQDGPVKKTGPDGYLASMAAATAGEMVRMLNLGQESPPRAGFRKMDGSIAPLLPSDMAVLVRDVTEARAIRSALDLWGVRSVYLSDRESVFDSSEAQSLVHILKACFDPGNERALRAALATPLLDLSLKELETLTRDESLWEARVELFRNFQRTWQTRGVLPMVRALVFEFNVGAPLLSTLTGERKLTNLLHLGEILQAESAVLDGESGVIRWLVDRIENSGNNGDDAIIRLESDQKLVRVITIHKSKGLEYPLVFLPFACTSRKLTLKNTSIVKGHDPEGKPILLMNPDSADLEVADRERLAEELRMLYVALTRSCFACFLGIGVMGRTLKSGESTTLHESALGYLMTGDTMVETAVLSALLKNLKGTCTSIATLPLPLPESSMFRQGSSQPPLLPARTFSAFIPDNWRITSYSGILANAAMPERGERIFDTDVEAPDSATQEQLQEPEMSMDVVSMDAVPQVYPQIFPQVHHWVRSIHSFPRGPEPGTFLHDIFEWAALQGFDRVVSDRSLVADHIGTACIARGWAEWTEVLVSWFIELLEVPLKVGHVTFKLSNLKEGQVKPELEFMFAVHGVETLRIDRLVTTHVLPKILRPVLDSNLLNGMVKGFIDLVFCFDEKYYILDYKSNHLGDDGTYYESKAMNQAMVGHRYDLQYVLYILSLHRLLKARKSDYEYDRDIGGAVYLFLRGVSPGRTGGLF